MASNRQPERIDPAVLLNDGPWDSFDALCRAEYARLRQATPERLQLLAMVAAPSLAAFIVPTLWLMGLSYYLSFQIVLFGLVALLVGVWLRYYGDVKPSATAIAVLGGLCFAYAAVVVGLAALLSGLNDDHQFVMYALYFAGFMGLGWFQRNWTRMGFQESFLSRMSRAFGFTYQPGGTYMPNAAFEHLGEVYTQASVSDHVAGQWRGQTFDAGRYRESADTSDYLLVRCGDFGFKDFCAEATTLALFPDEEKANTDDDAGGMDIRFRVRLYAGTADSAPGRLLRTILSTIGALSPQDDLYIAMEAGVVMVFVERKRGVFAFDEVRLQFDPDTFFQNFEDDLAMIVRIADALAQARKDFLYRGKED